MPPEQASPPIEVPSNEPEPPSQTPIETPPHEAPIPILSSQSCSPPIKRRRARPPSAQPERDDENNCTICLEPWTNSGDHHLCCMPCGHLFGYNCITQWLKSQPKRTRSCPTCKTPARVRDLRYIFGVPTRLRTVDSSDIDRLTQQLEEERQKHRETKAKYGEAKRLARMYRQTMVDLQRGRVASMEGPSKIDVDQVSLIGVKATNSGSIAVACDGATVLYTENIRGAVSEQRLCRTEINRLNNVTASPHTFSKRVNAMAVCKHSEMSRFLAVSSADRRVTVFNPSLQLAAEVAVSAVPTSVTWLSTPYHLAVGLLNGEVAIFDIRNSSGAPVLRPKVAERGWRAVHSLGELETRDGNRLIAGAPCGVVAISPQTGLVEDIDVGEGPITGVSVHDGLLMVAKKNNKPSLSIYDGLVASEGTVKPGRQIGGSLVGYEHDTPFIKPAILPGESNTRGCIVLCPDSIAEHGVAIWGFRSDGVEGERWVQQHCPGSSVGVRAIACAGIPDTAKIVGLPDKVRGVFAAVGDECLRLFSAGRYRG